MIRLGAIRETSGGTTLYGKGHYGRPKGTTAGDTSQRGTEHGTDKWG